MGGRSNNCKASLTAEADPWCKGTAVMVLGKGLQSSRGGGRRVFYRRRVRLFFVLGRAIFLSHAEVRPTGVPTLPRSWGGRGNSRPPR